MPKSNEELLEKEHVGIIKEEVDIEKESSELTVYNDGSLEALDREHEIRTRWFKERAIVLLSIFVICTILLFSVVLIAFYSDETSKDWGRQTLSALLGFAAGAIWQTKSNGG